MFVKLQCFWKLKLAFYPFINMRDARLFLLHGLSRIATLARFLQMYHYLDVVAVVEAENVAQVLAQDVTRDFAEALHQGVEQKVVPLAKFNYAPFVVEMFHVNVSCVQHLFIY